MTLSRRDFGKLAAGAGAAAALTQIGLASSLAQTATPYRAMVTVFLAGGNDSWNMVVPRDARYGAYATQRGASLALKSEALMALADVPFGLHPSFAPLKSAWDDGALSVVLNTGPLFQPLNRTLYQDPALRPLNLMSHADQQAQWQGMRTRDFSRDGFLGRLSDKMGSPGKVPPVVSFAGSSLAVLGRETTPLILPPAGTLVRKGFNAAVTTGAVGARQAAIAALADGSAYGPMTNLSAQGLSSAYDQAITANAVIGAPTSIVDAHFKNPTTGAALTSDIANQLKRVARMIEARESLGHVRQTFFVSQGGYDTHSAQVDSNNTATGTHAALYTDLAMALAGFYSALGALGLQKDVVAFTMSDFGRSYRANGQRGTDHAWGSNQIVLGGPLKARTVHGRYPDQVFGGPEDAYIDGRWIPSIAVEEYVGGLVQWFGVAAADLPYIFPNWTNWNGGGRGPVPFFA